MLSGTAWPKNVATAAGAALRASAEGLGHSTSAPLKEMLRLPTNARNWAHAVRHPSARGRGHIAGQPSASGGRSSHWSTFALPSRWISATDDAAHMALKRAGVSEKQIQRLLLSEDNNLSALIGAAGSEEAQLGQIILPFQRTPANVLREGLRELRGIGHVKPYTEKSTGRFHPHPVRRTAYNTALAGSGALGGLWALQDPRRRGSLLSLLLAGAGPATLFSTAAGMTALGGWGRPALGGLSPVPEMAFDLKTATGWPPAGYKLWQRLMHQRPKSTR
jgi:hypothetical protein